MLCAVPPTTMPAATTVALGASYGRLKQKHPEYQGELWDRLALLYEGGWDILEHSKEFIPKAPEEPSAHYKWRLEVTSYVNYFARLVGYLTGTLFNETLVMGPAAEGGANKPPLPDPEFYNEFASNADLRGTDFSQFMRVTLATALVYQRAIVHVDMPVTPTLETGEAPDNRAHEEALGGARAYLIPIAIGEMYNWEKDSRGKFKWCVLHTKITNRDDPFGDHSLYQHEFKIWRLADGIATYTVLRTRLVSREEELKDDDVLLVQTLPSSTSFTEIPLREIELPKALWVGNQAGPLCREHYRRRSDLAGSLCRSLVELPFIKRGAEIPAVHRGISETQMDPNRGADPVAAAKRDGWVAIGGDDELGYAGPSGVGHEIARAELKDCREEIFGSVNAMALQLENTAAAVGRSGESKAEDRSALAAVLSYLADQLREFAQQVMTLVSSARNEEVKWAGSGLSTFDTDGVTQVLEEAVQIEPLNIPSVTFKQLHRKKVALALVPKASPEQKQQISDEIDKNTTAEEVEMDPFERAKKLTAATTPVQERDDEEGPEGPEKQAFGSPAAAE